MNELIKKEIKDARLKYFEIANEMGVSQTTFYRKLNSPMTSAEKERILKAVKSLKEKMIQSYLKQA